RHAAWNRREIALRILEKYVACEAFTGKGGSFCNGNKRSTPGKPGARPERAPSACVSALLLLPSAPSRYPANAGRTAIAGRSESGGIGCNGAHAGATGLE